MYPFSYQQNELKTLGGPHLEWKIWHWMMMMMMMGSGGGGGGGGGGDDDDDDD